MKKKIEKVELNAEGKLDVELIIKILKDSREYYIDSFKKGIFIGMCGSIRYIIDTQYINTEFNSIRKYIPKMNPYFLLPLKTLIRNFFKVDYYYEDMYWWNKFEPKPRIDAFNKLIKYYEKKL